MTTVTIAGASLKVGQSLRFLGHSYRIASFEPYTGDLLPLLGKGTRIAVAEGGEWRMTVPPAMDVQVLL